MGSRARSAQRTQRKVDTAPFVRRCSICTCVSKRTKDLRRLQRGRPGKRCRVGRRASIRGAEGVRRARARSLSEMGAYDRWRNHGRSRTRGTTRMRSARMPATTCFWPAPPLSAHKGRPRKATRLEDAGLGGVGRHGRVCARPRAGMAPTVGRSMGIFASVAPGKQGKRGLQVHRTYQSSFRSRPIVIA